MQKERVSPGKFVAFAYKLYDDKTGNVLFEARKDAPDVMVYGISPEIVPGLAAAMKDLSVGDRFGVTLPPEAAFGPRHEENVMNLERSIFTDEEGKLLGEITVGAELPMLTQEGFRVLGRVLEITPDHVRMDFNHPFAGLTVRYDGEIMEVRDATPEELTPMQGCGCGCEHHDGCGDHDCGDHDCGDHGCGGCK